MNALAYLQELHVDTWEEQQEQIAKGKRPGEDRYVYVGPKAEDGRFPLIHMKRVCDLPMYEEKLGIPKPDMFYSLNAFWKSSRKTEDVRHLRALYVDLDCYAVGMSPMDVLSKIENKYIGERIPDPNVITFTGRGLNLIWFIDHVPKQAIQTWSRVGDYLLETLKEFGADPKCSTDVSRVFRLPGSINPKSGKQVQLNMRHENRFALHDLHSLYTPWEDKPSKLKKVAHFKRNSYTNAIKTNNFTWRSLNKARLEDIRTLQSMRNEEGIVEGYRETALMWHHYFVLCATGSFEEADEQTMYFNSRFLKPIRESQLKGIMKYSENHGNKWLNAYANLQLYQAKPRTRIHGMGLLASNKSLIKMFGITPDEQRCMKTIIGDEEYKERERKRAERNRRENGQVPRAEYLANAQKQTEDKLEQLKQLLAENSKMSNVKLGEELGVSEGYIRKLKLKL